MRAGVLARDVPGRLARAEALLIDVQASLEMLNNQEVLLDQAIEPSGAVTLMVQPVLRGSLTGAADLPACATLPLGRRAW